MKQLNSFFSEYKFFIVFLVVISIYLTIKTIFWPIQKNIQVLIQQQQGRILNLDTTPNIIKEKLLYFNHLNFREGSELFHDNTGYLKFKHDFFMTINTQMVVIKDSTYLFRISSDDGYRLKINNQVVCEQPQGQVFELTNCYHLLKKGAHQFELYYFQGYGHLGLKITYQAKDGIEHYIGKDSQYTQFIHPQ